MTEIILAIVIALLVGYYLMFFILCVGDFFDTKKEFLTALIPFYLIITGMKRYWDGLE